MFDALCLDGYGRTDEFAANIDGRNTFVAAIPKLPVESLDKSASIGGDPVDDPLTSGRLVPWTMVPEVTRARSQLSCRPARVSSQAEPSIVKSGAEFEGSSAAFLSANSARKGVGNDLGLSGEIINDGTIRTSPCLRSRQVRGDVGTTRS